MNHTIEKGKTWKATVLKLFSFSFFVYAFYTFLHRNEDLLVPSNLLCIGLILLGIGSGLLCKSNKTCIWLLIGVALLLGNAIQACTSCFVLYAYGIGLIYFYHWLEKRYTTYFVEKHKIKIQWTFQNGIWILIELLFITYLQANLAYFPLLIGNALLTMGLNLCNPNLSFNRIVALLQTILVFYGKTHSIFLTILSVLLIDYLLAKE